MLGCVWTVTVDCIARTPPVAAMAPQEPGSVRLGAAAAVASCVARVWAAAGAPRGLPDQGAVRGAVWPKAAFGAPDPCEACPDLSVRVRTPSGVAGRRPAGRPRRPGGGGGST